MNRDLYRKNQRIARLNERELRSIDYADSPGHAIKHLNLQPCRMPTQRQSEVGKLLRMQRERRLRALAKSDAMKRGAVAVERLDAFMAALKAKYDSTDINRWGPCALIIAPMVNRGASIEEVADYFELPLKAGEMP